MELLQLKYFCDAAMTENFSKTAKKFSVPPSDISQSIRRLEKELGVSLFNRNPNRVVLNESGRAFYAKVSEALKILGEAEAMVADDENKGELFLCINTLRRIVMRAVEIFQQRYPSVRIKTKFISDPFSEDFDLVIESEDPSLSGFCKTSLLEEPVAIAISKKSALAKKELALTALADEPFISMGDGNSFTRLTKAVCLEAGFSPRIAMQSDDPYYIRKFVELGLGVALVPTVSWKGQISKEIFLKEIEGVKRSSFLYRNKSRTLPLCAGNFIKILLEECEKEK